MPLTQVGKNKCCSCFLQCPSWFQKQVKDEMVSSTGHVQLTNQHLQNKKSLGNFDNDLDQPFIPTVALIILR